MSVYRSVASFLEDRFDITRYDLLENESLKKLTTFRIGGEATVVFPKTTEVLLALLDFCDAQRIPYYILGAGSNVLASDEGYPGLVIALTKLVSIRREKDMIIASCGVTLTSLASFAQKEALSGMEFFYGIPGSVGGAVFMNAGAYGGECKDVLSSVLARLKDGTVKTVPASDCAFGYRESVFQRNQAVILEAAFQLSPKDPEAIRLQMEDYLSRRRLKQPLEYPSAGSTFKRYPGRFTGQMIENAGLKGTRVGGAMVSEKHAGFLINYDCATAEDMKKLIELVRRKVYEKEGVWIECEIRELK